MRKVFYLLAIALIFLVSGITIISNLPRFYPTKTCNSHNDCVYFKKTCCPSLHCRSDVNRVAINKNYRWAYKYQKLLSCFGEDCSGAIACTDQPPIRGPGCINKTCVSGNSKLPIDAMIQACHEGKIYIKVFGGGGFVQYRRKIKEGNLKVITPLGSKTNSKTIDAYPEKLVSFDFNESISGEVKVIDEFGNVIDEAECV